MSIERDFDVSLIAEMALREKQIQQNYRPIIGVHKWFARRPGTLFRGLILAEFGEGRLEDVFFRSNEFSGIRIADPFMGGGTPLIEANRVGCDVQGFDVNPMSAWVVREEIESLDTAAYERAARALVARLHDERRPVLPYVLPALRRWRRAGQILPVGEGIRLRRLREALRSVPRLPPCREPAAPEDRPRVPPFAEISMRSRIARTLETASGAGPRSAKPGLRAGAVATAPIAGARTSIPEKLDNPWSTAFSPSSTIIRDGRPNTKADSSRNPMRKTSHGWPPRPSDGNGSAPAMYRRKSFHRGMKRGGCIGGGMPATGTCSIRASSSGWNRAVG